MVRDVNPGVGGSFPGQFAAIGSTLYFQAGDGIHGAELWKSDGTVAGTTLVKDINPGAGSSDIYAITAISGTLYFRANDGTHGAEPWKSDGTAVGTALLKDISPGTGDSFNKYNYLYASELFSVIGNVLYFSVDDGSSGYELWKSDGTAAGTVQVMDLNPGVANGFGRILN